MCIARTIAPKPWLIVLDEAVSSLDMLIQAEVPELISGLRRELRMAFLLISHAVRVV